MHRRLAVILAVSEGVALICGVVHSVERVGELWHAGGHIIRPVWLVTGARAAAAVAVTNPVSSVLWWRIYYHC